MDPDPASWASPSQRNSTTMAAQANSPMVASTGDVTHCLNAGGMGRQETETMVVHTRQDPITSKVSQPLGYKDNGHGDTVAAGVRRLTPRECERLQGFPDDWTLVPYRGKPAKDGPRYRAIGNGMAVPVVRRIGERIALFEEPAA